MFYFKALYKTQGIGRNKALKTMFKIRLFFAQAKNSFVFDLNLAGPNDLTQPPSRSELWIETEPSRENSISTNSEEKKLTRAKNRNLFLNIELESTQDGSSV